MRINREILAVQRLQTATDIVLQTFLFIFFENLILDAYLYCESSCFLSVIYIFIVSGLPYLPYNTVTCSAR